jgi:hypothetical protein
MDWNGIIAIVAVITSVGGTIFGLVNHKRIRSKCCNNEFSASIDVEQTTPPIERPASNITIPVT